MEKWVEGKSIRPKPIFWVIPGCLVDFSLLQHCRNSLNSTSNKQYSTMNTTNDSGEMVYFLPQMSAKNDDLSNFGKN